MRGSIDEGTVVNLVKAVKQLPALVEQTLQKAPEVHKVARPNLPTPGMCSFWDAVGDFPVAMEGALKLKEIAYVRAEGYAAGEMKHGPIALIEAEVLVVGVATDTQVRAKTLSNMQEMKARGGKIVIVVEEGHEAEMPRRWPTTSSVSPPART